MIAAQQLKEMIIEPVLRGMHEWGFKGAANPAAVNLLLGTAYHESLGGTYLHQIGGPAIGLYQIEPDTHEDIWQNYLQYRKTSETREIKLLLPQDARPDFSWIGNYKWHRQLMVNLDYATVMARLVYYRRNFDWPDPHDVPALAEIYKKFFNTEKGGASVDDFINHFPDEIL